MHADSPRCQVRGFPMELGYFYTLLQNPPSPENTITTMVGLPGSRFDPLERDFDFPRERDWASFGCDWTTFK